MNATLATSRTGRNGSSELWFAQDPSRWIMYGFVRQDDRTVCYKIDLNSIEERHNYGDMFSEGKVPNGAVEVEMSPVHALIHA